MSLFYIILLGPLCRIPGAPAYIGMQKTGVDTYVDIKIPALVYTVFLGTMAAHTSGVSRRMALGGLLFSVSDILIGFSLGGWESLFSGVVVRATYVLA